MPKTIINPRKIVFVNGSTTGLPKNQSVHNGNTHLEQLVHEMSEYYFERSHDKKLWIGDDNNKDKEILQQLKGRIYTFLEQEAYPKKTQIKLLIATKNCIDLIELGEKGNRAKEHSLRRFTRASKYHRSLMKKISLSLNEQTHTSSTESSNPRPSGGLGHVLQPSNNCVNPAATAEKDNHFEDEIKEIKDQMMMKRPIFLLWGPDDLDKTIVVKQLYNDSKIGKKFEAFAWISVPADDIFQPMKAIGSILTQLLGSTKKRIMELSHLELMEEVHKVQQEKKCLIVVCDVRNSHKWRILRRAFLEQPSGCGDETRNQILVTSRDNFLEDSSIKSIRLSPMDVEESWKLLNRMNPGMINDNTELQEKLKQLNRLFNGSHLAISILSGFLNVNKNPDDYKRLLNSLSENGSSSDVQAMIQSLLLFCYNDLNHWQLKQCFLYLGHFPEGYKIKIDELYVRWMDEFLISQQEDANLWDVAKQYFWELIKRNLVQQIKEEKGPSVGCATSCKLHPLVREFCIRQAETETEKLFYLRRIPSEQNEVQPPNTDTKVSIVNYEPYSYTRGTGYSILPQNCSRLHSVSLFDMSMSSNSSGELFDPENILVVKFLEFYRINFRGWSLINKIGKLKLMKHLSFNGCYIDNVPASIGDLVLLITLDLRVERHCTVSLPNVLWKLSELQRLYFPWRYMCADSQGKLELMGLTMIEILVNFNAEVCNVSHLQDMRKLRRIDAIVVENHMDVKKIIELINAVPIHDSSLDVRNFNCYSQAKRDALNDLLSCERLDKLCLDGIIKQLPDNLTNICRNLTDIELNGAELNADPMLILGQILKLRSLILCNNAYVGKDMDCQKEGFPELKYLKLKNLLYLTNWTISEGSMPKLSHLSIGKCGRLSKWPHGLRSVKALRELKIVSMPENFLAGLQEDDHKVWELLTIKVQP